MEKKVGAELNHIPYHRLDEGPHDQADAVNTDSKCKKFAIKQLENMGYALLAASPFLVIGSGIAFSCFPHHRKGECEHADSAVKSFFIIAAVVGVVAYLSIISNCCTNRPWH